MIKIINVFCIFGSALFLFTCSNSPLVYDATISGKEILTPVSKDVPKINGASVFGVRPEPVSENLNPRYSPADKEKGKDLNNLDGRAHMLRTPDKKLCYLYFEGLCNKATVNGLLANQIYEARWYNPRTGEWSDIGNGSLTANGSGVVTMPDFPGGLTQTADNTDWAAKLVLR